MESPQVRIGWLKMLLKVFRAHGADGLYDELIEHVERLVAAAGAESGDVR